ncbi:CMGC kinase [Fusarium mundagurra]|uniref:CMGC kinase n=1 Tax=Fusarium mundagurra TaxID=1567541 RepID=A0A8H5YUH9_9HYPO|nr:CMGC kinase [Fusarium mundagurra]
MLAKLGKTNHCHLVSVLGAYCQFNEYYLIFDWADCDLLRYWKDRHSEPDFSLENVLWLAEQCVGLASGLEQQDDTGDRSLKKLYGRHGDIKPENILWYRDSDQGPGTLRICDFGVSEIHSTQSRSGIGNSHVASSPYYRPPEWELQDGTISRSYDIWTIGCLYLEFLGWLLGGWNLSQKTCYSKASGNKVHQRCTCEPEMFGLCSRFPGCHVADPRCDVFNSDAFKPKLWTSLRLSDFYNKEWRFLAPAFDEKKFIYELDERLVLPFKLVKSDARQGTFQRPMRSRRKGKGACT